MTTTSEQIAELRRLEKLATPTVWCAHIRYRCATLILDEEDHDIVHMAWTDEHADNDARLIVAARNALPGLLDDLEAARDALDATRAEIARLREIVDKLPKDRDGQPAIPHITPMFCPHGHAATWIDDEELICDCSGCFRADMPEAGPTSYEPRECKAAEEAGKGEQ